jgi:WD40 repeat protein/serine/threonine protein kinase
MALETTGTAERDGRLGEVLAAWIEEVEAGRSPDRGEWLARHPEFAAELAEYFDAQKDVQGAAAPLREAAQAAAGAAPMGETLGDFRILREVGRGGMGIVYEAEQISLGRRVAVKVLPMAATLDPRQLQRFHNEARAAACLHHPNIVPVHFVGSERGVHFYAMQFIDGQPLSGVIAELQRRSERDRAQGAACAAGPPTTPYASDAAGAPTTPYAPGMETPPSAAATAPVALLSTEGGARSREHFRRVAELMAQAAEALDHAHQMGVVHRDVKPGNLLLDDHGHLWVADFGLALFRQGDAGLTMTGDLVGTLRYMSPEQALANRVVLDHRTDVYSLGATLYELLTLRPVVTGGDRQEVLRQIALEEPRPPRQLDRAVPPELETIALKALQKSPAERYASAGELAADLRRFLKDEPIRARRPTLVQTLRKWVRRHSGVMWSAAAVGCVAVLALVINTIAITAAYNKETEHRKAAEEERDLAKRFQYDSDIGLAQQALRDNDVERMQALLERHLPQPGQPDRRGWEWYYLQSARQLEVMNGDGRLSGTIRWSPDGKRLAASWDDQPLQVWTIEGRKKAFFSVEGNPGLAWAPDGQRLGATKAHGPLVVFDADGGREVLSTALPKEYGVDDRVGVIDWSPDGHYVAGWAPRKWHGSGITIWDARNGKEVRSLPAPEAFSGFTELVWTSDGHWLAGTSRGGSHGPRITVRDATTGEEWLSFTGPYSPSEPAPRRTAWRRDGQQLAGITAAWSIQVWDVPKKLPIRTLTPEEGTSFVTLAWSPDGRRLVAADNRGALILYDMDTGKEQVTFRGHTTQVYSVAWSGDGRRFASAGEDRQVVVWDADTGEQVNVFRGHTREILELAWSSDNRHLASRDAAAVKVWDIVLSRDSSVIWADFGPIKAITWSPDGSQIASASEKEGIRLWDAATGKATGRVGPRGNSHGITWGTSGRMMSRDWGTSTATIWDPDTGHKVFCHDVRELGWVALSPDGKSLAMIVRLEADPGPPRARTVEVGNIEVRNAATGEVRCRFKEDVNFRSNIAWSPDGSRLATTEQGGIVLWDVKTKTKTISLPSPHAHPLLSWSPNGQALASVSSVYGPTNFTMIAIWDPVTGQELRTLRGPTARNRKRAFCSVAWSPDSARLALATGEGSVRVWDAWTGQEVLTLSGRGEAFVAVAWSPDGRRLAAGTLEGTIHVWDSSKSTAWGSGLVPSRNNRAWFLVRSPNADQQDVAKALVLARKAVEEAPHLGGAWNTLGVVLYRAGNWQGSVQALRRSVELTEGGTPHDHLFLAMAHWQLREKDQAKAWYDKAVNWMDKNNPNDEELIRFRAEAAALLSIKDAPPADEKKAPIPKP